MLGEKDVSNEGESSVTKPARRVLDRIDDEKMGVPEFLRGSLGRDPKPSKLGSSELSLSYLCEKARFKGKEVAEWKEDGKWVERDFLNLKREVEEEEEGELGRDKKKQQKKMETLNLSLGLPDVSLSLTASNKNNNNQTTCSNDFSMSYSYFSHNLSCSLTKNSTDYSVGRDDPIWNCGEGTNGSVHSRFKPVGDAVALSNNRPAAHSANYPTATSDNISFFPSELPAGFEVGGDRPRQTLSGPDRILRHLVNESIPGVAQLVQELPDEVLQSTKDCLTNLISLPHKKDQLLSLQNQLARRSDLTFQTLSKCHIEQLSILVSIKTGLTSFLSAKNRPPSAELVDIFLLLKCRNVMCKSVLPVDDCDCKICSANKGFCSSCMCPVCLKFDCASNTCSWVGCDVCSHWCHAACGIQKNLIKPGPSLKGLPGTTEIQFNCIGCGHASEMFGFVKDVFVVCAKDWGLETLKKELDCVKKIFRRSEDYKGKELYIKADDMLSKLDTKMTSPSDACNILIQFFNYAETMSESPAPKEIMPSQANLRKDAAPPQPASLPPKYTYNTSPSTQRDFHDSLSNSYHQKDLKSSQMANLRAEDEFQFGKLLKKDEYDSLESIVRIKEAEARMFQNKADEAHREAEGYRRMIRAKNENLDEEYADKLSKLCLQETEERRRKKLEELKKLEESHCDYYNMKLRMQAEIAGLLERMEATKQQWV